MAGGKQRAKGETDDAERQSVRPRVDLASVLHAEEVTRARLFFRAVVAIVLLVAVFLPVLPGKPLLRMIVAGILLFVAALATGLLLRIREPKRYTPELVTVLGVTCSVLASAVIFYIGTYSAAAVVLAIGIYFFGGSHSRVAARASYATVVVLYAVASIVIASNAVPDESLFSTANVAPVVRWYQAFMSQVLFAIAFYLARSGRRATETAIERVEEATQQIVQRDAMLAEARRELDRALRPGEGRHTGQRIGAYKLGPIIGKGGMGEVYRGENLKTSQPAAVKLLHPTLLENPDHIKRFLREAQAAAAVRTEHVVQVIDAGYSSRKVPYIAMELLEGHDLGWHLRKTGRLPIKAVVELVEQVARGLAVVRDAGVVHRDLKPGNLFLTDSIPRKWKVLDFGLSKIITSGSTLTRDQTIGTPSYMAPEQVNAGAVDHRADLYALAGIAYRSITGSPPFPGDDVTQILFRVLYSMPAPPTRYVRLPVDVELVLAIGLAKPRDRRFATVEDFARAFKAAAAGELDDETRACGWALLKEFPWGSTRSARERLG
jgi:serine/threonine-protein kinase